MQKRDQDQPSARRVAARQRGELGVIATYVLELSERHGRGAERTQRTRPKSRKDERHLRAENLVRGHDVADRAQARRHRGAVAAPCA
jgi:hypothetical protein